jgi:hypothetical protein
VCKTAKECARQGTREFHLYINFIYGKKIVLAQDNYERYDVNMEYFILKDNGEHWST